jgi:hypothetical protein
MNHVPAHTSNADAASDFRAVERHPTELGDDAFVELVIVAG